MVSCTPILRSSDTQSLLEAAWNKMLPWMSKIQYTCHHKEFSKDLLPESGSWLLESREFAEWRESSTSSTFWLHGMRK